MTEQRFARLADRRTRLPKPTLAAAGAFIDATASTRPWRLLLLGVLVAATVLTRPVLGQSRDSRGPARPDRRIALVIGNGTYKGSPLRNPVNDARAIAQALTRYGFEVTQRENLSQKDMKKAVAEFGARLSDAGSGLFYYAGHGMQVNGRNYMIPIDADISKESDVDAEAVDVDAVLSRMDGAKNRMNIVILDACRDNPYSRSWRSAQRGLAQIQAGPGTLIAYATAPGKVAADGDGANGLYTGELLKVIGSPGVKIEDVFKRVRVAVQEQTVGAQVPWESSSLTVDFYFVPAPPGSEQRVLAALADATWNSQPRSAGIGGAHALDPARLFDAKAVERQVQQRLEDRGLKLNVEVAADGTVTLTGVVASPAQKSLAIDTARVAGVTDVRARINVQGSWRLQ